MNIAKKYFKKQLINNEFKQSYFEEKIKLDIEYQLEELKKDIETHKTIDKIIEKINSIEQYVMSV
ncbi:MAG: hypothetical protein HY934_03730 [Candidatus Firestonebacteria bacterium]|nr:hypothetical protein [Candidatus Firestonebacteria bacterium]